MIYFILNPNSGNKSNRYRAGILEKLQKIPNSHLNITEYPGHAKEITLSILASQNVTCIVAIGGDGTVNEIGTCLHGSKVSMGIIPIGSGNGLARHLGISMNFDLALERIFSGHTISIDTLTWNEKPFFCTAGIGFDAEVAHNFAKGKVRGLANYIRASLQTLRTYKPTNLLLENDVEEELFSLTFANANQYGNNAFISPNSNIQDAQFEVVKIKKGNNWQLGQLGISLFLKRILNHALVDINSTNSFKLKAPVGTAYHLDGESLQTSEELIQINILPKSLKVLV
jgi:YegS/Rv2252/BmrU family lipid kinase